MLARNNNLILQVKKNAIPVSFEIKGFLKIHQSHKPDTLCIYAKQHYNAHIVKFSAKDLSSLIS